MSAAELAGMFDARYDNDTLRNYRDAIVEGFMQNLSQEALREQISYVPRPGAENLRLLSMRQLSVRDLADISLFCFVTIREVQACVDQGREVVALYARDFERIERTLSDLVLRGRFDRTTMSAELKNGGEAGLGQASTGDGIPRDRHGNNPDALPARHRNVVYIARCKLVDALRNVAEVPPRAIKDPMRVAARDVTDRELALWMRAAGVADHSLLRFSTEDALEVPLQQIDDEQIVGHRLGEMGLMQLWMCMKMLAEHWPKAAFVPPLIALVDHLWRRTAFFMSYRERIGSAVRALTDTRKSRVLGLSLEMWSTDPNQNVGTLLDSPSFVQTDDGYAYVNMLFIRETERFLSAFERDIRCGVGFERECEHCLACTAIAQTGAASVDRFEQFCAAMIGGKYKSFVRERFVELVYGTVLRPSDPERFRKYNPNDAARARNIVASQRDALYKQVNKRLVAPQVPDTWQALRGRAEEPAYTLLAVICCDFAMRDFAQGARLAKYYHETARMEPYEYTNERVDRKRNLLDEMHWPRETTGTLRYRFRQAPSVGIARASPNEANYQHPLIVRTLNSLYVLYRGRLHQTPLGFGQAFVVWLRLMCTDKRIGGHMPNGAPLFDLWSRFCVSDEERRELALRSEAAERRKKRWDSFGQIINADADVERLRNDARHSQFGGQ